MLDFQETIRRNTVLAAVQRAIFCQETGTVLDIDDSYLVTLHNGKLSIVTGKAWRAISSKLSPKMQSEIFKEVWEGKTGDEVFPVPVPVLGTLQYLAAALQEQTIARHVEQGIDCPDNQCNAVATIRPGRVYVKIDQGGSGRFMVEKSTGIIFGIKGYGKVNKGREYGTLSTVDLFAWGGYGPALKGETDKEALENQGTARRACDRARQIQAVAKGGR